MLFRFFIGISFLIFVSYWFHVRICPEEAIAYHNLVRENAELRNRSPLAEQSAQQTRQGVQKDIWTQEGTRHFQMKSEHSELILSQKKEKTEAIEQLKDIRCSIDDEWFLTANEGFYQFPSHQFTAQKNCRLLQNQNEIDGTQIHFDLIKEMATYENPKGYLSSASLRFTAKKLIWHKKIGKLYLTDHVAIEQPNQFTLIADSGTLMLDAFQPTLLILEGNVRLISSRIQNKESYAVADSLTYNPLKKTLLFSAARKVLFWQEGLSLSASEVFIQQDQTIEGRGDVHFAFDLEEQNLIDEFFQQYL